MFRNETPPPSGEHIGTDPREAESLSAATAQLVQAVAAEPLPPRLRELALALGEALDRQRAATGGAGGPSGKY
ncbi:hypothetical protein [Ruixingdingia sedimenti]|uniref:Uncharacterized protein n=1 Tax=Ruixingdingia sedimenti TaxID=3073604 RepID=A0ABU1F9K1_9RHOB|nr:hypothetical protein [Xinfangfangia sp. LG-4]MDR5653545.1 hypothetical protein [Xinfangfangia sp. LG-4]